MGEGLKEEIKQAVWENKLPVFLGGVGVLLIAISFVFAFFSPKEIPEISFKEASESAIASGSTVMVDIEGAVEQPGVYTLPAGSRIQDGLIAAGGLSALADREKIAKGMNLASKLTDGAKVYFPKIGETPLRYASEGQATMNQGGLSLGTQSELININEASEAQLDTLPGIGPVTAQKIINGRPYSNIGELVSKKAVGQSVFEKIKDKITVN